MDLEAKAQAALDKKVEADNAPAPEVPVQPQTDGDNGTPKPAQKPQDPAKAPSADENELPGEEEDEPEEDDGGDSNIDASALPNRARYIYDNLPSLTAMGRVGKGTVKTFSVKTAQELPDKFEFASKRDELLFVQELADQSNRATVLDNRWQQQEQQENFEAWQTQQAQDIATDLKELQQEGLMPKFTEKQANDELDNPGVKLANEVYDYMQKTNTARANAGKAYFLSYRDAFELVQARKGGPSANADQERRQVANKIGAGRGTGQEFKRPQRFKSVWDIVDLHENDLN